MDFENISPYVRFVSTQRLNNFEDYLAYELVALDNRLYLCCSGNGDQDCRQKGSERP